MPKKTLALITGLVVVTIVLFIIALRAGQQQQAPSVPQGNTMAHQPTPNVPAHTVLMLGPNPVVVGSGQTGSVTITMNTQDNDVTAVQLELGYDPHIVSNVKVTPGPLFTNPVVLINKNNTATGRYTYAFGITPNSPAVKGNGVVATVSFTPLYGTTGKTMQLGLLPTSLVTARGVAQSVLKQATGTVINIQATAPAAVHTGTTNTTTTGK
ncbi:MAG TPA: cohesin domain-containing protein [Candidatus Acidoferrales bacterium]|nr:cohesin domain-containing protein [Candidatus Acidoferrales bacterium]